MSFFKEDGAFLKKYLPKIVLSVILIPISWFGILLLVDLSNIMIVAVGRFASKIVNQAPENSVIKEVEIPQSININEFSTIGTTQIKPSEEKPKVEVSKILGQANSFAGPLVTLGSSVLGLSNIQKVPQGESSKDIEHISLVMKLLIVVMFVIPLTLMIVV